MRHFTLKRLTAVVLTVILALGLALPAGAKTAPVQGPGGAEWELNDYPVVLVHGIGQSEVFLYEDDNMTKALGADGKPIEGWPSVDVNSLIPKLLFPLLASLLLQSDVFLTGTLRDLAQDVLSVFALDEEGRPIENMRVEKLHYFNGEDEEPTSLEDLGELKEKGYKNLPLQEMSEAVGEDKIYYFAYNSFGNLEDTTAELYKLINGILDKHNTDKVNIVPISLGGVIMNSLVERYKTDIAGKLNNVVYVIAALDGSNIAGDLITRQLATDNESLYRTMFPGLADGYVGCLLNIVIRLMPKRLVMKILDAVIDGAVGGVISRCTMMWGLVPQGYYDDAVAEWLTDSSMADIKRQTDDYHRAQVNARDNILYLKSKGVNCYAIAHYNFPMYNFVASAKSVSADGLLQVDSPSMGATSWGVNVTMPDTYTPAAEGKYMDPYNLVDAGTGKLPDHTWYFKDQDHERTGRNDVVMKLTFRLACGMNDETDVHSMDEWPQFNNGGRDGRWVKNTLKDWGDMDLSALSPEDRAEFLAAKALMEAQVDITYFDPVAYGQARERFTNIMIKIGKWPPPGEPSFWERAGDRVAWFFSEVLYFGYGPRGFIDPVWRIWCD